MRYEGFYQDKDFPVKPGGKVRVKKGTTLRSTHPDRNGPYEAGKTMTVKVNHILNGVSMTVMHLLADGSRYGRESSLLKNVDWELVDRLDEEHTSEYYEGMIPVQNPMVVWAGSGGYWVEADINDVEIIEE